MGEMQSSPLEELAKVANARRAPPARASAPTVPYRSAVPQRDDTGVPSLAVLAVFSSCSLVIAALAFIGCVFNVLAAAFGSPASSTGLPPQVARDFNTLATAGHLATAGFLFTVAGAMGTLGGIGQALRAHVRRHWSA